MIHNPWAREATMIQDRGLKEDQRMINLVGISYVAARKSIFPTQLCTLISSRSMEVLLLQEPTQASYSREEAEVDLERLWLKMRGISIILSLINLKKKRSSSQTTFSKILVKAHQRQN